MIRWRWGIGLLVVAIVAMALRERFMRGAYPSSEEDGLASGLEAFGNARHDLV